MKKIKNTTFVCSKKLHIIRVKPVEISNLLNRTFSTQEILSFCSDFESVLSMVMAT